MIVGACAGVAGFAEGLKANLTPAQWRRICPKNGRFTANGDD
jgi:hypothetical protein